MVLAVAVKDGVRLILVGLPARILLKLKRVGIRLSHGRLAACRNLQTAQKLALRWH